MAKKAKVVKEKSIEDRIWDSANKLRGNLTASEYQNVVLGLVFLKYISDCFEKRYNELVEEGDGFEEDRDEYTAEHVFWVPQDARWNVIASKAHSPEIGQVIDHALEEIGKQDWVLTLGRYVGIADEEEDAEPFEEKMARLTSLGKYFTFFLFFLHFFLILQRYKTINQNVMSEKFPYGYDVNAYIDKAFEQMKADFPWATRDMIAEHTYFGIEKLGDDYQYVRYYNTYDGKLSPDILNVDCEEFIRRLTKAHDWELEEANPVKECIDVQASNRCSGDWFLECYRIQKHEKGGYSVYVTAGNRSAGGSKTVFIPASYFKLSWEEFLDKYLDLTTPGSFYVGRADLERDPRIKEFLGF